ncbi:MAG: CehA/McbA family metallohydrolase [Candidatus Hydrogenedentes bacterium]|nr:CehA/McbA family metallohydrolase [Candidatus Hydrogenedentota bacterium]
MSVRIETTYGNDATPWLRGNLHTHSTNSDGNRAPQALVDEYAARGYDFLMLSDHDGFTDPDELDSRGMTLVPGVEVSAEGPHLLHVGARAAVEPNPDRQKVIDAINAEGNGKPGAPFAVMAHPNWEKHFSHCPQEKLEEWQGYAGIEVCNGICQLVEGSGLATDRWDMLLGKGRRVWGYGNDDCHKEFHDAQAWNMVQSDARDATAIIDALRQGRHYVSTGVIIERIRVYGDTIHLVTKDAQRIIAISDWGRRQAWADAAEMHFTVPADAAYHYLRFECWGGGEAMAWTQPFFVKTDA